MFVLQKPTVTAGMLTWCSWPPWRGPRPSPACCSGSSTAGSHPTGSVMWIFADFCPTSLFHRDPASKWFLSPSLFPDPGSAPHHKL